MKTIITNTSFEETVRVMKTEKENLDETGSLLAIYSTEYDKEANVRHDFMDIISEAAAAGYMYVNTIVYPTKDVQKCAFEDNVRYVVWVCKDTSKMHFNKDAIREKHIWKDVEWGKRAKNYNPKGKDPGNVWIPTKDDGKANITEHILMSDEDVIQRILMMTECGDDYLYVEGDREKNECNLPGYIKKESKEAFPKGKVIFKSSENMEDIEDGTIEAAVTSPPYWNLKDYFKKGQIGQESYEIYLERMTSVWRECYKKLTDSGSIWININIRVQKGKVILIPRDIVESCKKIGYFYKGIYIWHKSSGIPTGDKNIVDRHEYVLVFSKSRDFAVDYEYAESICDYKNQDINGKAFWNINRKAGSVGKKYIHPAIYPNNLVKRIVECASSEGDTVMDPFLGSGTSLIGAVQSHRNFVGFEFNEGFKELMESRFEKELESLERISYR